MIIIKKLIMRFNALKLLVVNIAVLFDKLINLQVIFSMDGKNNVK